MPEGHTIHRYAREHRKVLAGRPLEVTSPQGRFAEGAGRLDGQAIERVDPYGKHLFYQWSGGEILHVHLGLYGGFRRFDDAAPPPTPGTRLQMEADGITVRLAGPTACDLLDVDERDAILARLGPDPLRRGADPEQVWSALRRRPTPIGAALLDQSVIAGIGNVYRAEALFVCGIDPWLPSRDLDRERFDALWSTTVRMLREGVRAGRIVTVDPAELGISRRRMRPEDWRYVYKRPGLPCRRCATMVRTDVLATRHAYWCPTGQPPGTLTDVGW